MKVSPTLFLQKTIQGLSENPLAKEIQVRDLYAESFDPLLVFNVQKRRRDMHLDPELENHRNQLLWAEKIVFVYPIWWGRPPAMLMGYIDRIFASNFAYRDKGACCRKDCSKARRSYAYLR